MAEQQQQQLEGGEKISKNEQKKLAKKAATKLGKAAPAATATTTAKFSTATPALASIPPAPTLTLVVSSAAAACSSSTCCLLKVVWAARHFGVELNVSNQAPSRSAHVFKNSSLFLVCGDEVLGGGGNAMAKAICDMVASTQLAMIGSNALLVENDEWCEWERTQLRGKAAAASSNADSRTACLQQLADQLQHSSSGGLHVVSSSSSSLLLSLADICILSTLSELSATDTSSSSWPKAVLHYLQAHEPAMDQARRAVQEVIQQAAAASTSSSTVTTTTMDYKTEVSLVKVIHDVFVQVACRVLSSSGVALSLPMDVVKKCQNPKHGDYQCTAAMRLFGQCKKDGTLPAGIASPVQLAQAMADAIPANHPVVNNVTVVQEGGAFIVCRVTSTLLQDSINELVVNGHLSFPKVAQQTCLVDFSSPNIAKEMHVGHLRSTIIGESVCRILEAVGHTVHRVNHVGDWGTQFGMLIQYLREEYPQVGNDEDHNHGTSADQQQQQQLPNITDLTEFYKAAKERFDASPEFKKQSQQNVVDLQSGDASCLKIWKMLCDISRLEFEKVYKRLDVSVTEVGESFYNDKIPPVIEEFDKAGLLTSEEGGAKVVFVDKFKNPLMLQKSDGGYGYDSTDMAALKYRLHTLGASRVIVITDFSQGDHFKMVYSAGRKIGWVEEGKQRLDHIGFGTVMGEDGKRFKTRSGDTVRLVDLLDEAVRRMEASLQERMEQDKANITSDELHEVAEAIGYGAVKYYDLRRNPTSNYKFSYDQMLDTKGDTAVYLLYARVRLESILAKAATDFKVTVDDLIASGERVVIAHESERELALALHVFGDIVIQTLDDLYPYHICEYVYKLANAASDFVTQCKVLGSPEMKSRLLMCYATTVAMKDCFDLLGIRHVKRI